MDTLTGPDVATNQMFWLTFEQAAIGMALISPKGRYLRANPELCRMLDYSQTELSGLTVSDVTYPEDRRTDGDLWNKIIAGELSTYHREKRYVRRDGDVLWAFDSICVVRDEAGVPMQVIAVVEDISHRKRVQAELEQAKSRYRAILDNLTEAISVHDLQGRFLFASGACTALLGYTLAELVGTDLLRYVHPEDRAATSQALQTLSAGSGETLSVHYRAMRKDGLYVRIESSMRAYSGADGYESEIVCASSALPGMQSAELGIGKYNEADPALNPGVADPLTGLPGKGYMESLLSSKVGSQRSATFPFGVLCVDVDRMKVLNDTYGLREGDEVLKSIARTLRDTCRVEDVVARTGSDEFSIFLPNTNPAGTIIAGEKLIRSMREINWPGPVAKGDMTISIGATCVTYGANLTLAELMSILARELAQAKQSGGNRLVMNAKQSLR